LPSQPDRGRHELSAIAVLYSATCDFTVREAVVVAANIFSVTVGLGWGFGSSIHRDAGFGKINVQPMWKTVLKTETRKSSCKQSFKHRLVAGKAEAAIDLRGEQKTPSTVAQFGVGLGSASLLN
jgi:hypothetical protein